MLTSFGNKSLRWSKLSKISIENINIDSMIKTDLETKICGNDVATNSSHQCNNSANLVFGFIPCPNAIHCVNADPFDLKCRAADTSPQANQINKIWNQNGAVAVWHLTTGQDLENIQNPHKNKNLNKYGDPILISSINPENTMCQYDKSKDLNLMYCIFLDEKNDPAYLCEEKPFGGWKSTAKWYSYKLEP